MAPKDHKLWGCALCWLSGPRLLLEKSQQLSLLLVASPRKRTLFWGLSQGYPQHASQHHPLPVAVHMGSTEEGGEREANVSLQETSHYIPQQTGGSPALPLWHRKLSGRMECCPMACQSLGTITSSLLFHHMSGCHICPRANSSVLL